MAFVTLNGAIDSSALQAFQSVRDDDRCEHHASLDQSVSPDQMTVAGGSVHLEGFQEAAGRLRHAAESHAVAEELARLAENPRALRVLEALMGIPHDEAVQILELARKPENLERLRQGEIPPELEPYRDVIAEYLGRERPTNFESLRNRA